MKCRIITALDGVLHILRNPDGFSEETIREARLQAADALEAAERRLEDAERLADAVKEFQRHPLLPNYYKLRSWAAFTAMTTAADKMKARTPSQSAGSAPGSD